MGLSSFMMSELNYRNSTKQPKINEFLKFVKNEVLSQAELKEFQLLEKANTIKNKEIKEIEAPQNKDNSRLLSEEEYNLLISKMI